MMSKNKNLPKMRPKAGGWQPTPCCPFCLLWSGLSCYRSCK